MTLKDKIRRRIARGYVYQDEAKYVMQDSLNMVADWLEKNTILDRSVIKTIFRDDGR